MKVATTDVLMVVKWVDSMGASTAERWASVMAAKSGVCWADAKVGPLGRYLVAHLVVW